MEGQKVGNWKKKPEERSNNYCQHHGSIWGLVVLFAGLLLLLNTFGTLPWGIWNFIWPFWPVLVILVGMRIIFGFNAFADAIMFLAALAILCFIAVYGLIHVDSSFMDYLPQRVVDFVNNFDFDYLKIWSSRLFSAVWEQ